MTKNRRFGVPLFAHGEEGFLCGEALMINRRAIFFGTAALLAGGVREAQASSFDFTSVAEGVYVHVPVPALPSPENQGDIANLGLVIGETACAVIDTGGSIATGLLFRNAIAAVTALPVRYVINTHIHPDHVFGNQVFEGEGVTFIAHKNFARDLAANRDFYLKSYTGQLGAEAMKDFHFVAPGRLVEGELTIDLGNRPLKLKGWPAAHTDCDLTVLDERSGTLFTGDLVFREHLPVIDGSLLGWLKVMDDLAKIRATRAVPGHGPVDSAWPSSLTEQKAYLERLASDAREDIRKGEPLAEAMKTMGETEHSRWMLFDDYNGRNASQAYKELEWE